MMNNSIVRFFVSLWIAISIAMPAHAAQMCQYVFNDPSVKARDVDFGIRSEAHGRSTPIELAKFAENKKALWDMLDKLPAERKKQVEHLLAAVEFFDYTHTADAILTNFLDGKRSPLDFSRTYDRPGEGEAAPFNGFLNARDSYLRVEKPEVTADVMVEIHKRIMEGGVEGIKPEELGALRGVRLIGNAVGATRLNPAEIKAVDSNSYLYFAKESESLSQANQGVWDKVKIWGKHRDMGLAAKDPVLAQGKIHYPSVLTPKDSTIELIKDSHPDLYTKILVYRQEHGILPINQRAPVELEQQFIRALMEQRLQRFAADRAKLGEVKIGINEHEYIDLVADVQRDIVAIHPFRNGNGRTTRLFMNYLLTKEGLPPVRLVDPFLDVQVSQKEWREYVHKGVVNEAQLQADVLYRIKNGLTVEYAPDLIYPGLPENVSVTLKKQGSDKVVENYSQTKVDASQFNAFLKTLIEAHPELRQEIKNDRLRAMSKIADLFVEHYRSKNIRYIHDKDGEGDIALRFVDPDFIDMFGVNRSGNKQLWENKINRWYDKDLLVWRGLSNRQTEYTNEQLLNYFQAPSTHLLSNSAVKAVQSGKSVVQAAKEDFKTYNQELLNGDVVEMAVDHHRTGPRYRDSYGYSTSKREIVGKAFAMGAMVVGEYGSHKDPALQAKLKSRINVASFRALKDVDLGRLKAFDPEFSYIYGRQAEVMGIGGTDADAVVLIQKIDATGNVTETLFRNFEKPDEILLIEGRYVPTEGPLAPERIKGKFTLAPQKAPVAEQQPQQAAAAKPEVKVEAKPAADAQAAPQDQAKPGVMQNIFNWFGRK